MSKELFTEHWLLEIIHFRDSGFHYISTKDADIVILTRNSVILNSCRVWFNCKSWMVPPGAGTAQPLLGTCREPTHRVLRFVLFQCHASQISAA